MPPGQHCPVGIANLKSVFTVYFFHDDILIWEKIINTTQLGLGPTWWEPFTKRKTKTIRQFIYIYEYPIIKYLPISKGTITITTFDLSFCGTSVVSFVVVCWVVLENIVVVGLNLRIKYKTMSKLVQYKKWVEDVTNE